MFKYLKFVTCFLVFNASIFATKGSPKINLPEEERSLKGIFKVHQTHDDQASGILFEEGEGLYGLIAKHNFPHPIGPENTPRAEFRGETRKITHIYSPPEERDLVLIQFDQPFTNTGSFPRLPETPTETGEGYLLGQNCPLIHFSSLDLVSPEVKNLLLNRERVKSTKNDLIAFAMREESPEFSQLRDQRPQFNLETDFVTIVGPLFVPKEGSPGLDTVILKKKGIPLINDEVLLPSSLSLSNKGGMILINPDNQIQGLLRKRVPGYREDLIQVASCPPNDEGYKAIGPHVFDYQSLYNNYKFRVTLYAHPNKSLLASVRPLMVDLVDLSVLYDFAPVLITHLLKDLTAYFSDNPEQSEIFYPAVVTEQDGDETILETSLNNVHALTYYYFLPIYELKDWILDQIKIG
ncbi:MAG: hypothetical protein K2P93_01050 [Alphaproteobacteria bacterium]|nr:hypothetical protein [Alphaproteobacteria bacterium]